MMQPLGVVAILALAQAVQAQVAGYGQCWLHRLILVTWENWPH